MAWILLGTVGLATIFFLVVFLHVSQVEARLRALVVACETQLAKDFDARLVPPGGELRDGETAVDADPEAKTEDEEKT